ncbi:hypothetical protein AC578_10048 [Pseudocercospora eumusae]|uniref:Large ribosomal subunit protein mL50 n=1 Tax=Pseudocercospora eumusae TaxID=321146 RepID=A0A139H8E6_9PEZI|nr:hypothetical protein AC578_10048 [Pseudocercospora eumusae]
MRRIRVASEALRIATEPSRQPYVCRSCMAQAARQFHTTPQHHAEVSYYQQLKETVFGKKTPQKTKTKTKWKKDEASTEEKSPEVLREEYLQRKPKILNGVEYEVAKRIDPAKWKDYVPATTWHGLERVGSRKWAKAYADRGEKYEGFVSKKGVNIDKTEELNNLKQQILKILPPSDQQQRDLTKINILQNPELKLSIIRLITQTTGHRLRDPHISKCKTAHDLFLAAQTKPPPKKLKDDPRVQELGASKEIPNVRVHATKRTSVHKETEIGRWKVIEDELKLRGLPVFGTKYPNAKEGVRLREKKVDWKKHGVVKHVAARK